jgi:D-sedoheptulose 7-phosphate isomerase
MTGAPGGRLPALCDACLAVAGGETARIQEGHAVLIHVLCALVEERLFPGGPPEAGTSA